MIKVHVKISSTLRKHVPDYDPEKGLSLKIDPAATPDLASLAQVLGLPVGEIKFAMLNGHYQPLETMLKSKDRVAFFPAVGGG